MKTLIELIVLALERGSTTAFVRTNRNGVDNQLHNCVITGFDDFEVVRSVFAETGPPDLDTNTYDHDLSFSHCGLHNPDARDFPSLDGIDGNIEEDPMFIPGPVGFELDLSSPYVNAGSTSSEFWDFARQNRTVYGTVDIGALETQ